MPPGLTLVANNRPYTSSDDDGDARNNSTSSMGRRLIRGVQRCWAHILTSHEQAVLLRLIEMTNGRSWKHVDTSVPEILGGTAGHGEIDCGPLGFGRRTGDKALSRLRELGLIETKKRFQGKNVLGLHISLNEKLIMGPWAEGINASMQPTEWMIERGFLAAARLAIAVAKPTASYAVPTAPNAAPPRTTCGVKTERTPTEREDREGGLACGSPPVGFSFSETKASNNLSGNEPERSEADGKFRGQNLEPSKTDAGRAPRGTDAAVNAARSRIAAASPSAKPRRIRGGRMSYPRGCLRTSDVRMIWERAWERAHPHAPATCGWTLKTDGQVRTLFEQWPVNADGHKPIGEFTGFIEWVVENWQTCRGKFDWMAKRGRFGGAPTHPEVGFILSHMLGFHEVWADRARNKLLSSLEIGKLELLRASGHSYEQALDVMAEQKFAVKKRQLDKREEQIRDRERRHPAFTPRPPSEVPSSQPAQLVRPAASTRWPPSQRMEAHDSAVMARGEQEAQPRDLETSEEEVTATPPRRMIRRFVEIHDTPPSEDALPVSEGDQEAMVRFHQACDAIRALSPADVCPDVEVAHGEGHRDPKSEALATSVEKVHDEFDCGSPPPDADGEVIFTQSEAAKPDLSTNGIARAAARSSPSFGRRMR